MLFTQDRNRTREMFRQAWNKRIAGEPLEPLEKQVADLVEDHPEYHALITSDEEMIDKDYTPEGGVENPFLHLGLHLALREQVGTDRPQGIASITRSLLLKHGDGHTVEHLMIECLGVCLWEAQRQGTAPDEARYLENLKRLL